MEGVLNIQQNADNTEVWYLLPFKDYREVVLATFYSDGESIFKDVTDNYSHLRNRGIGAGQIIDRSKLHLYLNKLQHCGINLYIQNEQLILLDEEGHPSLFAPIMIATLSTCAQLERDNISFRLQSGRKRFISLSQ